MNSSPPLHDVISEKNSSLNHLLNEVHDEVNAKRLDEYEFHANDEWMIHLIQDSLFQVQVFERIMLYNNVFADALHSIELFCMFILNEVDLL